MLKTAHRAGGISLRQLLENAEFFGAGDIVVRSCASDARACQPGDLFAALCGASRDGHDFAGEAVARGAAAVLAERYLPIDGRPMCVVPDSRAAFGRLCHALAGNPSRAVKVIGVGGSRGRTVTACLVASVLKAAGHQVGVMGSLGYSDSLDIAPSRLVTPQAPELASWLARMSAAGCSHAVVEVSQRSLAQSRMMGVELDVACVTGVRRTPPATGLKLIPPRAIASRIFEHLGSEGLAVINADDSAATDFLSRIDGPALTVGAKGIGEITGVILERSVSEQTFLISAGSDSMPVRTRMIGPRLHNCLLATAIGLSYGIDLTTIARGLEAVDYVPGRLERIECGQPFSVFLDHARTPGQLATALKTVRGVTQGKLICVVGAAGERDRRIRPMLGQTAESLADHLIVTTNQPGREAPEAIAGDLLSGCKEPGGAELILDRAAAIRRAVSLAEPGDSILLAGKGTDDHEIAKQTLHELVRPVEFRPRRVIRPTLN